MTTLRLLCAIALAALAPLAAAQLYRDVYTPYDGTSGITCQYFNRAGTIEWRTRGGDYGPAVVAVNQRPVAGTVFAMDVTPLLDADGIAIRGAGARTWNAHSREAVDPANRPRLVVTKADGSTVTVAPLADTRISCSGGNALGTQAILKIGPQDVAQLYFPKVDGAASARLELVAQYLYTGATTNYTAHAIRIPRAPDTPGPAGLASKYADDIGLRGDPDVLFFTGYEPGDYGHGRCPASDPPVYGYVPNGSPGVAQVRLGTRGTWDVSCYPGDREYFAKEEREIFLRMEIRFGSNFRDTSDGGKLPVGFTAQYDDAAGREYCGNAGMSCASGDRGWSARGGYQNTTDRANPVYPRVQGHQYVYHYRQADMYGTNVPWGALALFEQDRWYTVEMQIKVNTPGVADGEMRWWIDGRLSREVTGFQFRGPTTIGAITQQGGEQLARGLWLAFFHGGKNPPEHEMHAWVDNVVAARRYIGPRVPGKWWTEPLFCPVGSAPRCAAQ
jgi:hypothetical protein